jgi:hypothetical protein
MDNSQVTIAVQASGLRGAVGQPILVISAALDGDVQELVMLSGFPCSLHEVMRKKMFPGPVKASQADLWSNEIGELFYQLVALLFGIQGELEIAPDYHT